ncbi:alpha/beta fold hydrolase [Variovorax sp. J31P207]|uniref:alpha/beta fold hydrolase n=1 Tax=Variovorax sp. J31P207 TaxID=3053510 RepID=UPI002574DA63|nr:alpha/beta fold hydrolase [Variovorax sp. J31P207]MDM0066612.1 alpha/beta fold hydrolase [Variovorax sp. J31P207]
MAISHGEHTLDIHGRKLRYKVAGRGPVLMVQAPGWGIGCGLYEDGLARLESRFTVVHHDPQGSGGSDSPSDPREMNVGSFIDDLEVLRRHLKLDRFALMGHSHGGFIAMNYVLKYPQHVSHLIALDAQLGVVEPVQDVQRTLPALAIDPRFSEAARLFAGTRKLDSDQDLSEFLSGALPLYFFDPESEQCKAAQQYVRSVRISVAAMKATSESDVRFLVRERLGEIRARTLVLVGRHDFICSPVQAEAIHEGIADSQMVVFENSGHLPWAEEPASFLSSVTRFLESPTSNQQA